MAQFRFTGQVEFLGHQVPVDLWFECSTMDLAAALSGLLCRPDDPARPLPEPAHLPAGEASPQRPRIADGDLFDEMVEGDDPHNWQVIADRFPWLFQDESPQTAVPGLSRPPKNLKDIKKLQQPQAQEDTFEADLDTLRSLPRESLLKADGTVNISALARELGYSTGGGKWDDLREMAAILQAEYDEMDLDRDLEEVA